MQEANIIPDTEKLAEKTICGRFSSDGWTRASVHVPTEMDLTIYINGEALVNVLCTPAKLNCLVIGYLYAEGIITSLRDVAMMRVCEDDSLVDVRLNNPDFTMPTLRTLASGCGGGGVFKTQGQKVESDLKVAPKEVLSLMKQLQEQMELYRLSGGVHTSALSDTVHLLVVAEDIGRHNTLNKIQGECLLVGMPTRDRLLLITGRISSEMLIKAAKMEVPIVVSRHAPTGSAISLASDLGISLVGQARGDRLAVFSHPERLGYSFN